MSDITRAEVEQKLKELRDEVRGGYVTRFEFDPVKTIVFGLVSLCMTGLVIAILALIIRK